MPAQGIDQHHDREEREEAPGEYFNPAWVIIVIHHRLRPRP